MPEVADLPVSSPSDLVSMAPADLFDNLPAEAAPSDTTEVDTGAPAASESETIETPESIEGTPEVEEPEPAAEPEPATGETTEKPAVDPTPTEELPEGVVHGKDRNGKEGFFLEKNRYETFHGSHKLVKQFTEMLGEPATPEAIQLREEAFLANQRLFNDLSSGDAASQAKVVNYFLDEMTRAREEGEIGVDASVPFAQSVYSALKERAPEGFANLRLQAARDLIGEMYQEAAANGDDSLWLSAQHFTRALANLGKDVTDLSQIRSVAERAGLPFYAKAEMAGLTRGPDPLAQARQEIERLRAQVDGRSATNQTAQFDTWFKGTSQNVNTAVVDEAVKPALASVQDGWKNFPEDYNRLVVDPLHREVLKTIKADDAFNGRIQDLHNQARRAVSAQVRDRIGQQIKQVYVNRAKLAAEAVKQPILSFAATRLKEQADQNHARRQAAQNRTAPKGATNTVPRGILPKNVAAMGGDTYDPRTAMQQMAAMFE